MDSIFALASAPGKAGVAVVRVSGPRAWDAVRALTGSVPLPRQSSLRRLRDACGEVLDEALVLVFDEGASFTGEKVAELHLHGSIATQRAVLRRLSEFDGLRLAEAGEFTRRALENNRLDLTQVEALSDLIEAETESQRVQALRVFSGKLGERIELWRKQLIEAASLLEAVIDFADEEVPVDVTERVSYLVKETIQSLEREISGISAAERLRTGFEVAIVGAPNVGKSTLLNALAGREAAITSELAGTTRDVIEVRMEIDGLPVTLLDTAGLRETDDYVEQIGISRALERAKTSDLRVLLLGDGVSPEIDLSPDDIVVRSKSDITGIDGGISAVTGQGIDELVGQIGDLLKDRVSSAGLASRERHRVAFLAGQNWLKQALAHLAFGPERYDLSAEEIRTAIRALEVLIGRIDVENLLDEIFSSFCIGK
ncbi:tRNA uridine-5-carboxymethylaminomethyl(34) synthesis GTPase MnmE [Citreicella sp. C3M06]|uniref:tRNA uridine-5-carboxymethylaminomethyl(34) synthesis GTPase MnmE n=1 Tax=Citreicella sp. C3M06 TaxID=2841564 RepID=UPI001C0A66AA|nr:tRNA uridine-5-carboxymethylaminomethyl(34) synthesis GTPase MnmE [Citreicella sp. C3M06]MBU2960668.1 tRNA uridine-5-carboxymethylaminomethyl(34) synthesis GTPase MnmE [Citreicella sp. C3M06]